MPKEHPDRRAVPLRRLLSRLWHQRDAHRWTVHGHDKFGHRARMRVGFSDDGITLDTSCSGRLVLAPMQAGRLRAVIRDAIDAIERPGVAAQGITQIPVARPIPKPWPPAPRTRTRVVLDDAEPDTRPRFRPVDVAALNVAHANDRATEVRRTDRDEGRREPGGGDDSNRGRIARPDRHTSRVMRRYRQPPRRCRERKEVGGGVG